MKRYCFYLVVFLITNINLLATDINLNHTVTENALPTFFTGASMADLSTTLNHEVDEHENIIASYINSDYLKLCKALKISDYRFPEGTGGNYYHFYGKGSGMDTSEIYCNSTYFGIQNKDKLNQFKNIIKFEKKLDKNYAYYFVDFMKEIKKEIPDAGFYYHLNSHTHIYKGQLKGISSSLQYLINQYFNNNHALLNKNFDLLLSQVDTNQIKVAVEAMNLLKQDSNINLIKNYLLEDSEFQYSLQENLNSIRYFKSENIKIKGIEIGNETEAEYMLFDDDFSYFPYTCSATDDTLPNPFSKLLFRDYIEGMLKNWILTTIYADSIHQIFNIPIGLTVSGCRANIGFKDNEPYLLKPFGSPEKKAFIWSKFFASENKIDAFIPHIYTPRFIDCNAYNGMLDSVSSDQIYQNALKFIQFFNSTSLPYALNYLHKVVNGKPLWITEWNFNMHSFVPNTFLHAYFLHLSVSKHIEFYEKNQYNIDSWLLHYLSSSYFAYALIKTGYKSSGEFEALKLLTYDAFFVWNKMLSQHSKKLDVILNTEQHQATNLELFINEDKTKLFLHYNNVSFEDDYLDLNKLSFKFDGKTYKVNQVEQHILKANTLIASNFVDCPILKSQIPNSSYKVLSDSLKNIDSLKMPALSFGQFTFDIIEKELTPVKKKEKNVENIKIYPNPANSYLTIDFNNHNFQTVSVEIFGIGGNLIYHKNYTPNKFINIDVSNYISGIYIVKISTKGQLISVDKFVKE